MLSLELILMEHPAPPSDVGTEWVEDGLLAPGLSLAILVFLLLALALSLVAEIGYSQRGR